MNSALRILAKIIIAVIIVIVIYIFNDELSSLWQFIFGFCGGALMIILFILLDKI